MRRTVRSRLVLHLGLVLASVTWGCGSEDASNPPAAGGEGGAEHAASTGPGQRTSQHGVLPNASVLEGSHGMQAPNTAGVLRTAQSGESSYDASAPATVLVTTRWGHGSGVIVDPKGLVLTNYHVIEAGQTEDFEFRVKVTTVDIQKNGSVKPGPKYDAVALAVDPKRDLALLRLEGAPEDLPSAPLARDDPKPGRRVAAIGNAGVGFGWAVKHCNINAIGTLESRAEAIFHLHGETWSEEERAKMAEAVEQAAKAAGLQIQTDCTILPGDSGGPLIDEQTHELVGLNVSVNSAIKHSRSLGSVAYHIHVSELRDFMSDIPGESVTWVPDPWEVAGSEGTLADSDGDGELDSLLVVGACNESMLCHALFADVDQNSFARGEKVPPLAEVYAQRAFDAELVAFGHARLPRGEARKGGHVVPVTDTLLYFDRDDDGSLETLIVRDGETGAVRGYKGLDGTLERDQELDGNDDIGGHLFVDAELARRVDRFADAFERPSSDPRAPVRTTAVEVRFDDHGADGKADTLYAQTRLDMRLLMDADQDSIALFEDNAAASEALAAGTIDAEFMAVNGTPMRVWYDTDDDGDFDLLLVGPSLDRGVVLEATRFTPEGGASPAPEHIGRRMLRPGLLADPADAGALERMFTDAFPQDHAEVEDGLSSFPGLSVHAGALISEVEDSKRGAVQVVEFDRVMVLVDLDRDSFKAKDMKEKSVEEAVRGGRFEAEFAFVFDGIMAWSYYDGDNDGSYELVLVSRSGDPLHAEEVFTLGDELAWDTPDEKTPMFDSQRFSGKKRRKAFAGFEELILDPEVMGEAR